MNNEYGFDRTNNSGHREHTEHRIPEDCKLPALSRYFGTSPSALRSTCASGENLQPTKTGGDFLKRYKCPESIRRFHYICNFMYITPQASIQFSSPKLPKFSH